jgi:hypothetical protein
MHSYEVGRMPALLKTIVSCRGLVSKPTLIESAIALLLVLYIIWAVLI